MPETLNEALRHHRGGRLQEAEVLYRQVLQEHPNHPDALHLLGLIAHQVGRHVDAADLIGKAIALKPRVAEFYNTLGAAYRAQGKLEEAQTCYRQALALRSDFAEAHNNLGNALHEQGKFDEAAACYQQALACKPDYVEAHTKLGNYYGQQGKLEEAVQCYRQALALKPDDAEAHTNLGNALREQGKLEEALACYRQAITVKADYADAHHNLSDALWSRGLLEEASASSRRALTLKPDFAEAHLSLGHVLTLQGQFQEAKASYRRALALRPDNAAWHSVFLFDMSYHSEELEVLAQEYRDWNERHARPLAAHIRSHANTRDKDRRLRVGYVSGDFWGHAISYFAGPLLSAHDRARVEVYCYANGARRDGTTTRLQKSADSWRNIVGMSDEAVAEAIRADGIDILIDLSGHSALNRLLVFARKPAPVQVTYLGYGATTGLSVMDYRLSDAYLTPPDTTEWFSEELIRLPGCYVCYRPPDDAPPVTPLPASLCGYVTFGSFNNLAKVTASVVSRWAEILRTLPTARLVLKDMTLADTGQQARFRSLFETHGVNPERIELIPKVISPADHLALYGRIDIGLDSFPYNGCTTTCDAFWMGVPVVTLAGCMSHGRYGVSLLSTLKMDELIATTPADYVANVVGLAGDPTRLSALRSALRPRMAASPLCDAKAFAQKVEQAYRRIWRRWCRR